MGRYECDQVDYHALISKLSLTPNHPYSLHVRNHLLAPYAANPPPPSVLEQDAWTTYKSYRRGAQVVVLGDFPRHLTLSASPPNDSSRVNDGRWGVAIVFPSYAPGWVKIDDENEMGSDIWHGLRVSMWLSSEHDIPLSTSEADAWRASVAEEDLVDYVFHDFVPNAARRCQKEQRRDDAAKEAIVDLFAVNDAWVNIIGAWSEEGTGNVKLTRANPCMMFIKSEDEVVTSIQTPQKSILEISTIQEGDMQLVQQTNSLKFPLWYINHRRHISIMLRFQQEALAWAYAHDDLSMASLHVVSSHRRQGLGQLCVHAVVKKLIQAQKDALTRAGFDVTLPTPAFLDTEMHKGASRLFFEAQGYKGVAVLTWGSITVSFE